jgi:hypothetical protein
MGGLTIPCREDVFLDITSQLNWIPCSPLRISQDWHRYMTNFCSLDSHFQKIFSFVVIILGCKTVHLNEKLIIIIIVFLYFFT